MQTRVKRQQTKREGRKPPLYIKPLEPGLQSLLSRFYKAFCLGFYLFFSFFLFSISSVKLYWILLDLKFFSRSMKRFPGSVKLVVPVKKKNDPVLSRFYNTFHPGAIKHFPGSVKPLAPVL